MDPQLKQRLVGAAVLVSLAVLVVPVLLDGGYRDTTRPRRDMAPMPPDRFEEVAPALPSAVSEELAAGPSATPDVLADTARTAAIPGTDELPAEAPEEAASAVPVAKPVPPAQLPAAAPAAAGPRAERWAVQLGSFASRDNAEGLLRRMREAGVQGFVLPLREGGRTAFRVRAGPVEGRAEAERLRKQLEDSQGIRGMLVRHP